MAFQFFYSPLNRVYGTLLSSLLFAAMNRRDIAHTFYYITIYQMCNAIQFHLQFDFFFLQFWGVVQKEKIVVVEVRTAHRAAERIVADNKETG